MTRLEYEEALRAILDYHSKDNFVQLATRGHFNLPQLTQAAVTTVVEFAIPHTEPCVIALREQLLNLNNGVSFKFDD